MSKESWGQWASLGGELAHGTSPAISSRGPDRLDVFVTGTDEHLWRTYWEGDKWSGWEDRGGLLSSSPSAVSLGLDRDRIDVFAQGKDRGCLHTAWDGKAWGAWGDWQLNWTVIFGLMTPAPAVSSWGLLRLDLFFSGAKLTARRVGEGMIINSKTNEISGPTPLWHMYWDGTIGTTWWAAENLGGELTSSPAAVSWGPNRIDVFARDKSSHVLHQYWTGSAWSGWKILDKNLKIFGNPAVSSRGPNLLDVFVTGSNNHLMHMTWNGSNWSSWEDLGGELTSSPSAVSWGPDRIDVVASGMDGHIYHKYLLTKLTNVVNYKIPGGEHLSSGDLLPGGKS